MPPKVAAAVVPAAIEKKDGAKVVYITLSSAPGSDVKIMLNTSCRTDVLVDAALRAMAKEVTARVSAGDVQLVTLKGAVAEGAEESPELVELTATLARLRQALTILNSSNVNNLDLIEVSTGTAVSTSKALSDQASTILRPSGIYKLATCVEGQASQAL